MSNPFGKPLNQGAASAAPVQAESQVTAPVESVGSVPQGNPFGRALTQPTVAPVVEPESETKVKARDDGKAMFKEAIDTIDGFKEGLDEIVKEDTGSSSTLSELKRRLYGNSGTQLGQHYAVSASTGNETYEDSFMNDVRETAAATGKPEQEVIDDFKRDRVKNTLDAGIVAASMTPQGRVVTTLAKPVLNTLGRAGTAALAGGIANPLTSEAANLAYADEDRTNTDRAVEALIGAAGGGLAQKGGDVLVDAAKAVGNKLEPVGDAIGSVWDAAKRIAGKGDTPTSYGAIPDPSKLPYPTQAHRQDMAINSSKAIANEANTPTTATLDSMRQNISEMGTKFANDGYVPKAVPQARPANEIINERLELVGNHNPVSEADIIRRANYKLGTTPDGIRSNVAKIIGSNNSEAIDNYIDTFVKKELNQATKRIRGQHKKGMPQSASDLDDMIQEDRWVQAEFEGVTARDLLAEPDALIDRLTYLDNQIAKTGGAVKKDFTKQKSELMKELQGLPSFGKFQYNYANLRTTNNALRDAGFVNSRGNTLVGSDLIKAIDDPKQYAQLDKVISKLPKSKQELVRGNLAFQKLNTIGSVEDYRQMVQFSLPPSLAALPKTYRTKFEGLNKALFRPLGDNLPMDTIKEIQKVIIDRKPSDKEMLSLLDSIAQSKSDKKVDAQVQKLKTVLEKRGLAVTPVTVGVASGAATNELMQ